MLNLSGTTSWKLQPDKGILELLGSKANPWKEKNGFRYFKLIQSDVNSSGNHILLIGGFEIFGTLIEDINCPNGFLRKLGQFGLDSLYKNKNNPNQIIPQEENTETKKESNIDANSDESVFSYSNPSVINCEISDVASEYSTTSSNRNFSGKFLGQKKASKITKFFSALRLPAGSKSGLKIDILPNRTNSSSINGSQISESENKKNREDRDEYMRRSRSGSVNNNNNNDENNNENKMSSNDLNQEFNYFGKVENTFSNRSSNKSMENTNKITNRKLSIKSTPGKESFFSEKDHCPNISPLSTKNLEKHRKESSFK